LEDKIFQKAPNLVIDKSSKNSSTFTKATTKATSNIIFAAAFPGLELAGGVAATLTGVETEHDFAERDAGVFTGVGWFDIDGHDLDGFCLRRRQDYRICWINRIISWVVWAVVSSKRPYRLIIPIGNQTGSMGIRHILRRFH
jgi:hypothetical protein